MAQLIQRAPVGLLALLDSKAGGSNPSILADQVQPTIDLTNYYETPGLFSRNATHLAAAIIGGTFVQTAAGSQNRPAQDEIWRLRCVSIAASSAPAAGTAMNLCPAIFDTRSNDVTLLGNTDRRNGATQFFGVGIQVDIFLRPQFSVGFFVIEGTTPTDVVLTCLFNLYKPV